MNSSISVRLTQAVLVVSAALILAISLATAVLSFEVSAQSADRADLRILGIAVLATGVFSSVLLAFGAARIRQAPAATFDDIFSESFGYDDEYAAEFFAASGDASSSDFDRFADDPYSFVPSTPDEEDMHVSARVALGDR